VKIQLENLVLHMYKTGIGYSEAVREFEKGFILTVLRCMPRSWAALT